MIDFEIPARDQGGARQGARVRSERVHPRRRGMHSGELRRGAGRTPQEGEVAGAVVSLHPGGVRRHGSEAAGQRAGPDGTRRELPRSALPQHAGSRRRDHADAARERHRGPEGALPEAAAGGPEADLLLDDRQSRRRRRHGHADLGRSRRRQLRPERREVVQLLRERRRRRPRHGEDRSRRRPPPAVLDLPRRVTEPRLQDRPRHRDDAAAHRSRPEARRLALGDSHREPHRPEGEPPRRPRSGLRDGPAPPRLRPAAATACTTSRWRSAPSTSPSGTRSSG